MSTQYEVTKMLLRYAGVLALVLSASCESKKEEAPAPGASATPDPGPALQNGLTEAQAKQTVAKIGDQTITLGEFAERLGDQSPYLRARYSSPERRREFLDNMVRFELLAMEAKKRGLDKEPDVDRIRRQMMVQQMMKEMFDDKGVKLSDISEEEIKAFYDANPGEFHKPAQRRASHILFKDKAKAQAALKKLLDPAANAKEGEDMELFRKLAKDNQDAETKERYGDLRFFSLDPAADEQAPPKSVRAAAFKLAKTGDVAPEVIESEQGFHVLKLTGERAAIDRTLEDARRLIQNRLWRQKREQAIEKFVGELRAKAEIKENLALLSDVKIDTEAPAPGSENESHKEAPTQAPAGSK